MGKIDLYIQNFLEARNAQDYNLESIRIEGGMVLKENQVLFIDSHWSNGAFAYASADEYYHHRSGFPLEEVPLTQNLGYIKIIEGSPILMGTLLSITKYKYTC